MINEKGIVAVSDATIEDVDLEAIDEELDAPSEYSTSTPARAVVNRDVVVAPAGATGRRKEAVARVRIVPGTAYDAACEGLLRERIRAFVDPQAVVSVSYVEEIPRERSGKLRLIKGLRA